MISPLPFSSPVPILAPASFRLTTLGSVAVLLADVASKNWALAAVGTGYIDLSLIALTVVENEGLAFSTGAGVLSEATLIALRLGALTGLLLLAWRFGGDRLRYSAGFAFVLGGGSGNALDVLLRDGAVVDFISTAPLTQAVAGGTMTEGFVLNLADVWILTGLALLYPLFATFGRAVQRRLERIENRVLGRPPLDSDRPS